MGICRKKSGRKVQSDVFGNRKHNWLSLEHLFLRYKSELLAYGVSVGKIFMKEQTIEFVRTDNAGFDLNPDLQKSPISIKNLDFAFI